MTATNVGGAVLGPSRLPPARPNICQSRDCHAAVRLQLGRPDNRIVWVCRRCAEYWIAGGWRLSPDDAIGKPVTS